MLEVDTEGREGVSGMSEGRWFNRRFHEYKEIGVDYITLRFLFEFSIFANTSGKLMACSNDRELMNLPVVRYISCKYGYLIRPFKRGKHFKNIIRKISRDENIKFERCVGPHGNKWIEVSLKDGVAPLGQWHREESRPVKFTPDEVKAETHCA